MRIEDRIASDEFLRYERFASRRLKQRLPSNEPDAELDSIVRVMALDAASKFNADRGAAFSTFLFGHLQRKSVEFVRNYYRECRNPTSEVPLLPDELYATGCPAVAAEVSGLFSRVSEHTGSILKMAMDNNTSELRRAFSLRTWKHTTAGILGVSPADMQAAVCELKLEIPRHLSSVDV